jgi:hypothetical protein
MTTRHTHPEGYPFTRAIGKSRAEGAPSLPKAECSATRHTTPTRASREIDVNPKNHPHRSFHVE